ARRQERLFRRDSSAPKIAARQPLLPGPVAAVAGEYERAYATARDDPEALWAAAAERIVWRKPYARVLDASRAPFHRWIVGGELNTCYNALDRDVDAGRGGAPALRYDSPVTGRRAVLTFAELRDA